MSQVQKKEAQKLSSIDNAHSTKINISVSVYGWLFQMSVGYERKQEAENGKRTDTDSKL